MQSAMNTDNSDFDSPFPSPPRPDLYPERPVGGRLKAIYSSFHASCANAQKYLKRLVKWLKKEEAGEVGDTTVQRLELDPNPFPGCGWVPGTRGWLPLSSQLPGHSRHVCPSPGPHTPEIHTDKNGCKKSKGGARC